MGFTRLRASGVERSQGSIRPEISQLFYFRLASYPVSARTPLGYRRTKPATDHMETREVALLPENFIHTNRSEPGLAHMLPSPIADPDPCVPVTEEETKMESK